MAPRLAFRLKTTVATACIAAEADDGRLLLPWPCYGGSAREITAFRTGGRRHQDQGGEASLYRSGRKSKNNLGQTE